MIYKSRKVNMIMNMLKYLMSWLNVSLFLSLDIRNWSVLHQLIYRESETGLREDLNNLYMLSQGRVEKENA